MSDLEKCCSAMREHDWGAAYDACDKLQDSILRQRLRGQIRRAELTEEYFGQPDE